MQSLNFFIQRISMFFKSFIMHCAISKTIMFSVTSFYRAKKFSFFFIKRITMNFKSLIMQSTKTMSFVWSCATRYGTLFLGFNGSVMLNMISHTRKKLKIFGSIIQSIFIDVVDCFVLQKRSAKRLFHNYTMFIFPLSVLFDYYVGMIFFLSNALGTFWSSIAVTSNRKVSFIRKPFLKTLWASFRIIPSWILTIFSNFGNNGITTQITIFFKRFSHNLILCHERNIMSTQGISH